MDGQVSNSNIKVLPKNITDELNKLREMLLECKVSWIEYDEMCAKILSEYGVL